MRNVFDQYTQPENKLTHALVSTLANDRKLLVPFLKWLGADDIPKLDRLRIVEQQVPGEADSDEDEGSDTLPDAFIFDDAGWALMIESKVQAPIRRNQLERHRKTAERHGFEHATLIVIAVDPLPGKLRKLAIGFEWREVYRWFSQRAASSEWAHRLVEYIQIFESKMIAQDYDIKGTLTMFDGIHFGPDNPYSYGEGKRLIRLLGDALQGRRDLRDIGVDPKGERRSSIMGRAGEAVWDFLPLEVARNKGHFTGFPHLTLGIARDAAYATLTIPNGVKGGFKTKLRDLGKSGFRALVGRLARDLGPLTRKSEGAKAMAYVTQRHHPSRNSPPNIDGRMDVDLRTVVPSGESRVKCQPEWVDAIYDLLTGKKSNIQFGVYMRFDYGCPVIRSTKAVDLFAGTWVTLAPLLDFVLGGPS